MPKYYVRVSDRACFVASETPQGAARTVLWTYQTHKRTFREDIFHVTDRQTAVVTHFKLNPQTQNIEPYDSDNDARSEIWECEDCGKEFPPDVEPHLHPGEDHFELVCDNCEAGRPPDFKFEPILGFK